MSTFLNDPVSVEGLSQNTNNLPTVLLSQAQRKQVRVQDQSNQLPVSGSGRANLLLTMMSRTPFSELPCCVNNPIIAMRLGSFFRAKAVHVTDFHLVQVFS